MGAKTTRKHPSHWSTWTPSNTSSLHRFYSPPQTTAWSVHALSHNHATKSPLVTMGRPKFTPKMSLPFRRSLLPPNTPIPRPTPLTIPNGIRIQLAVLPQYTFWGHRPIDRLTHKPTDRWDRRQLDSMSTYARYIDRQRHTNNAQTPFFDLLWVCWGFL